uniref:PDZ domain-containing protein n=1 Tax=Mesocestoides corti TaxID=53468 RepID=A0A5K3FIR0_MESCO
MTLVAGGAHLDFRSADSYTPLHKSAISGNYEAIKVLLDLGQSPNTRDSNGLTPLYHCMLNDTSAMCAERLLFDHSVIGITDSAGLEEIHQACRFGRVQHLEQLIAYGADINSQTTYNGNTPLHFCAYNGQESCARLLLFRGANRTLKNRAGHSAYQEAVLANHVATANLIRDFQDEDIVPLRGSPKYNQQRRPSCQVRPLGQRCSSLGRLAEGYGGGDGFPTTSPNSPAVETKSKLTPPPPPLQQKQSTVSNDGHLPLLVTSSSGYSLYQGRDSANAETVKPLRGIRKTSVSGLQSLAPNGSLTVGRFKQNRPSCNPPSVPSLYRDNLDAVSLRSCESSITGRYSETSTLCSNNSRMNALREGSGSILDFDTRYLPRVIVLQKGPRGFGFVVQSKRATGGVFTPTDEIPSLHYLGHVEENNVAYRANLRPCDFILEVNNLNVATLSHQQVVEAIRDSGDMLSLKVVTLPTQLVEQFHYHGGDPDSQKPG